VSAVKRRNLLQSGFFRYLWPSLVIADDMNLKAKYLTTNNGSMYSTWIGDALGRGANRLVIDDPHAPADAYSEASRESAVKFIRGSLFSRLDNPGRDAIVIAHARVHVDDITGVLLDPARQRYSATKRSRKPTANPRPRPRWIRLSLLSHTGAR
jgi:hypothetical protein